MEGYGLSSLGPTVGLSGLPDPMGDATAALEARRRQQVTDAGYPGAAADATNPFEGVLSALGPTINERAVAAREAMRRGDMATANALNQSLALDFGQFLGSIKPIRAYHGSPHDFDRFDMSKIGTGEGGQAYGHGLYFAENEGVARSYRDTLSDILVGGKKLDYSTPLSAAEDAAVWAHMEGSRDAAIRRIESTTHHLQNSRHKDIPEFRALEYLRSGAPLPDVKPTGRMYEVDIHADPSRFLDLDAPLRLQSDAIREAAAKAIERGTSGIASASGISGSDIAAGALGSSRPLSEMPNVFKGASMSDAMRDAGIPGIKYLDAGSRSAGDGSRNYVVFDDKIVEILRKYGIMAPVAGAGLSALYLGDEEGM